MVEHADQSPVKLVVFDLGRVLVRICDDWRQACTYAGFAPPAEMDPAQALRVREFVLSQEMGKLAFATFADDAAPLMGLSPAQIRAFSEAYIRGPYPGSVELVDELSSAGVATACLSNTNDHHWELMSTPGHSSFFPLHKLRHRFASHLVGARKPDEAIYAHVERATGLPAEAILFFDDVPDNVEAAQKRGWNVQRIDPAPDEPIAQIRDVLRRHRVI